jgi:glutamine amidotransferase
MQQIAVIDYGMGNLRSVSKALETVSPDDHVVVTSDAREIERSDKIVCPGQGAAADCMAALRQHSLIDTLNKTIGTRPFFGICMGLQVLLTHSEENQGVDCCNLIEGQVRRFAKPLLDEQGVRLKVPHMGWSQVSQIQMHPLWQKIPQHAHFYFAHSYYCEPDNPNAVVGECVYGLKIAVALQGPSLFACQFHPEKSAKHGLQLLKSFCSWSGGT